jgi:arylsulfatase
VYVFSHQARSKYRVASDQTLSPGKHTTTFDFNYDGVGMTKGGTGTLTSMARGQIRVVRRDLRRQRGYGRAGGRGLCREDAVQVYRLGKVVIELGRSALVAGDEKSLERSSRQIAAVRD